MSDDAKPSAGTSLSTLSDEQVVSLTGMLDQVRDTQQGAELRQSVLDRLRPQLRVARPPRPLTLSRVFCLPFEDLLHDEAAGARPGMIARAAIMPAWLRVGRNADARTLEDLRQAAAGIAMGDHAAVTALGRRLWPIAARAIAAGPPGHAPKGDAVAAEIAEIAAVLDMSDRVEALRALLVPKLVPVLTEEVADALSTLFRDVAGEAPERQARLARLAMARFADPVELLPVLPAEASRIARGQIVADMERNVAAVAATQRRTGPAPDPERVAETAESVVLRIRRIGEMQQKGDADPALRLLIGRVAAAVKSGVVDGSEAAILAAVTTDADRAGSGGPPVADVAVAARAEDRAWSLKRCERIAGDMGLTTDIQGAVKQAASSAERSADRLIASLRTARPAPSAEDSAAAEPNAASETTFYRAVRLLEILVGPDRADTLRLKGEAVMQSAIDAAAPRESALQS